jgi:transcriptional regulator with XRE-family HTH domain
VIIPLPPIDEEQAALGRRLRRVREARGLSAGALAGLCAVAPARLALAEHGRTRLTSVELHALTTALRISLRLLGSDDADLARLKPF